MEKPRMVRLKLKTEKEIKAPSTTFEGWDGETDHLPLVAILFGARPLIRIEKFANSNGGRL
jgi:hypothetical protein